MRIRISPLILFLFLACNIAPSWAMGGWIECLDYANYRPFINEIPREAPGNMVEQVGNLTIIGETTGKIRFFDTQDVNAPVHLADIDLPAISFIEVDHQRKILFVCTSIKDQEEPYGDRSYFQLYSFEDPALPQLIIEKFPTVWYPPFNTSLECRPIHCSFDDGRMYMLAKHSISRCFLFIYEFEEDGSLSNVNTHMVYRGTREFIAQDGFGYSANSDDGLEIFRLGEAGLTESITKLKGQGLLPIFSPISVQIKDNYLYALNRSSSTSIVDISQPEKPRILSTIQIGSPGSRAFIPGDGRAYISDPNLGLAILDISNPANPNLAFYTLLPRGANNILPRDDGLLTVSTNSGVLFMQLPVSGNIPQLHVSEAGTYASTVLGDKILSTLRGKFLVLKPGPRGVPEQIGEIETFLQPLVIDAEGTLVSICDQYHNYFVIDVSDPTLPTVLHRSDHGGSDLAVHDGYAYRCDLGLEVVDATNAENTFLARVYDFPANCMDIKGSMALIGTDGSHTQPDSLLIMDATNPANMIRLGSLELPNRASAIVIAQDRAYVSVDGGQSIDRHKHSLLTIDISKPGSPVVCDVQALGLKVYDLVLVGQSLYIGTNHGLRVFDLASRSRPVPEMGFLEGSVKDIGFMDGDLFVRGVGRFFRLPAFCREIPEVTVDIKPGNDENPINCSGRGRGFIPVAILTTPDFDATTVDPTTVRFGPDEAIESHTTGRGTFRSHQERHQKKHVRDVDHDGDLDQIFHFRRNETGIKCGDTKATLTGETYEGQEIIGADRIRTVSRWDKDQVGTRGIRITPNPFNPQTTISFTTEEPQRVRLAVYDIRGRLLGELTDQQYEAGEHSVEWQGRDSAGRALPSGEYFFRVEMGDRVETRKAMLVR